MLNAAVRQCEVFGGKLVSFDEAKIAKMPGVKRAVKVDDVTVAVIADTWWRAKTALDALPIVWDEGPNANVTSAMIAKIPLVLSRHIAAAWKPEHAEQVSA